MPSPVAQIELPELDVTEEEIRWAKHMTDREFAARWEDRIPWEAVAEQLCRERQLLDALTQLSALREASKNGKVSWRVEGLEKSSKQWCKLLSPSPKTEAEAFAEREHFLESDKYSDARVTRIVTTETVLPPQPASAGKDK